MSDNYSNLDFYANGAFTPTQNLLINMTGTGVFDCRYTRVGTFVNLYGTIDGLSVTALSARTGIVIGNLPFVLLSNSAEPVGSVESHSDNNINVDAGGVRDFSPSTDDAISLLYFSTFTGGTKLWFNAMYDTSDWP